MFQTLASCVILALIYGAYYMGFYEGYQKSGIIIGEEKEPETTDSEV